MNSSALGTSTATQIGLVVHDIEATAQAWALLLGVPRPEISITASCDFARTVYRDRPTTARAKLAFFRLGQVTLELIEPIGEPSTWRDQLVDCGQSLHHVAFEVKGLKDRLTALAEMGLPLLQNGEYDGGRYAYLDGRPGYGTILELLEND